MPIIQAEKYRSLYAESFAKLEKRNLALKSSQSIGAVVNKAFHDLNRDIHQFGLYVLPKLKVCVVAIAKTTITLISQAIKICLIAYSLGVFVAVVFPESTAATAAILFAPIIEEILFRGIIQTGIEYTQKGCNLIRYYSTGHEITSTELKTQQVFRVRMTALLFGLAHYLNEGSKLALTFQVTFCIIHGLTFGYFKERTNSLAAPILLHAWNNTLATAMKSDYIDIIFPIWLLNVYGTYRLATQENH